MNEKTNGPQIGNYCLIACLYPSSKLNWNNFGKKKEKKKEDLWTFVDKQPITILAKKDAEKKISGH